MVTLTMRSDTIFIGYGRKITCSHCNNNVHEQLWQNHNSSGLYGFQFIHNYRHINCICPICNWGVKLKKQEVDNMLSILSAGKEQTLLHFKKLAWKDRKTFLKNLERINQNELVVYLSRSSIESL